MSLESSFLVPASRAQRTALQISTNKATGKLHISETLNMDGCRWQGGHIGAILGRQNRSVPSHLALLFLHDATWNLLESDFIKLLLWHLSWMGSKPRTLRQWDSFCLHRFVKMIDASRVIRWLNKKLVDSTSFRVLRQNEKSQNSMSHNCSPKRIAGSSNLPALCFPPLKSFSKWWRSDAVFARFGDRRAFERCSLCLRCKRSVPWHLNLLVTWDGHWRNRHTFWSVFGDVSWCITLGEIRNHHAPPKLQANHL